MFKIRKEQMDAQSKAVREHYEDRLYDFLCEEFPEAKDDPPAELRAEIHRQVEKAKTYGLESEQDVALYLTSAWMLGKEFDTEFPAANEILKSPMRSPAMKAEDLSKLTERLFLALEEEG
jgi:hypothetical protein